MRTQFVSRSLRWLAALAAAGALVVMLFPMRPVEFMSSEPHVGGVVYEPWWTSAARSKDGWWSPSTSPRNRFMPLVSFISAVAGTGAILFSLIRSSGGWTAAAFFTLAVITAVAGLSTEQSPTPAAWMAPLALLPAAALSLIAAWGTTALRRGPGPARH